jgi:hypothetical protein
MPGTTKSRVKCPVAPAAEYSDGEIAERLNADGVDQPDGRRIGFRTKGRAPARPPTVFSKDSVRELLQHEVCSSVVAF